MAPRCRPFSRGKEFTAAGLSSWVGRLGAGTPSAKLVRLARVVRKERGIEADKTPSSVRPAAASVRGLVMHAGALRVQVADQLDGAQLELVMSKSLTGSLI